MSEGVVIRLEEMLPECVYFEERGIFDKAELSVIMASRRKYEYSIASRQTKLNDYLSYIDHEIQVECRRRQKFEAVNIKKTNVRDFAIIGRIHSLFNRCLNKYSADVSVWQRYIDFCVQSGGSNHLTKVLMKAIKRHPRNARFRIMSANRELQQGSLIAARKLLMRAVRVKTDDQCLVWQQLFKLECAGVHRAVTGTVQAGNTESSTTQAKESLPVPSCQPAMVVFRHAFRDLSSTGKSDEFVQYAREAVGTLEMSVLGYTQPLALDDLVALVKTNQ
jgi:hypothetical protein